MCVIVVLSKNQMIPYSMLENACYNNWHSFGLVTKVDGKLDIKRSVPKSGEVDPKTVYKLLEDDIGYERFLHLRHNTAGATNEANCHPFDVYYDPKSGRQVVFMHNGTLYPFKSKKIVNNVEVDDDGGPSDTKNFVDRVLIPYLCSLDFGNGKADIEHRHTQELIKKFWTGANRGVLISSDQRPFFIDDWKQLDDEDGGKFLASNDDYFKEVKRGPENDRRLLREKQLKELVDRQTKGGGKKETRQIVRIEDYRTKSFDLSMSLSNVVNDWSMFDRANATKLGFATREELEDLFKNQSDCLYVMDWVFTDYAKMYEENLALEDKLKKASNIIAGMVEEKRAKAG